MKKYEIDQIRNVALVGNGGCGKTSFGEAMLFTSGSTKRLGRVDDETSLFDFEPEEKAKKNSISTAIASFDYKKNKITLLDTPGFDVFLYDTESALKAADAAVFVVSSEQGGIKFESEKIWQFCDDNDLPRALLVTKLDKERTDLSTTLEQVKSMFGVSFAQLALPIGSEEGFEGYVDLIKMRAVTFSDDSGKGAEGDIPAELANEAEAAREAMIESLVETDEELMEKYFDGQEITNDELKGALRNGVLTNQFVPVVAGSAEKNIGADMLLNLIIDAFPSPADRPAITGTKEDGSEVELEASEQAAVSAVVFKTITDPFAGKLNLLRVFSGTMKGDVPVWNTQKGTDERCNQLLSLMGKDTSTMEQAGPGDILAVAKLKETGTGDTFSTKADKVTVTLCEPPVSLVTFAAYPKAKGDEEKMGQGLKRMQEEDPTLRIEREPQTHELLVSGMGRLHIDTVVARMKRKFGADVDLRTPKVPYRETIKGSTKVQGRHKKQSGGRGQFADTWIEIRPSKTGEGFKFVDKIVGGAIPRQYIPAVEAGIFDAMKNGVVAGYPMVDVEVTLYDGKYHDVDSSEMAFKIAGSIGFKKGAVECKPILLEPINEVQVKVPDENMGDIIGDLNSRRGRVLGMDPDGNMQVVKAHVPLSEIQEYAPDLRSMTSGRGTFTMQFDHYEEVPAQNAEKIVAAAQAEKEEE